MDEMTEKRDVTAQLFPCRESLFQFLRRHRRRVFDRRPAGNSPARGWLVTERLVRELEESVR